jgi:fluoroacetyl-CoA thioesterase
MLTTGIKGTKTVTVNQTNTAATVGSGELDVFATPAMLALMEACAAESIKPFLDEDSSSVGISANIKHVSATPVGMTVTCVSELTETDGKRLVFKLTASDESGLIGEGTHERFIISKDKFLSRTYAKLNK